MSMHTRKPYKLDYNSYLTWMREFVKWLTAHAGDADFPSHVVPDIGDFEDLIDQFEAIAGPYKNLITVANAKNKLYTATFESLSDKLVQIKLALVTIADDPDILALFDLAGELPDDRDDMYMTAQNCLNYWATVSGEAMFAPMIPDFDALQTLFDDFVAAREVYFNTDNERETKQNELLAVKEQIDEIERGCFQWYRSRHPEGNDEWWTGTEWGTTSGGGGEEPGPPEPPENWDDAPTGFTVTKSPLGDSIDINCGLHPDADGINVYIAEGPFGGGAIPVRPQEPEYEAAPMPLQVDVAYDMRHWLWVCAVKDGVEGAFAGPLWIEFTETVTPIVPV